MLPCEERKGKVYNAWLEIKRRCYNPNCKSYVNYGARGISFEEFKDDFLAFLNEVGYPPTKNHSINRIDNSIGYIRGNMEWALHSKQVRNRRKFKNNTSGFAGVSVKRSCGKTYILAQWSDLDGRQRSKSFSEKTYGYDLALQLAKEYRDLKIIELNQLGAEYGTTQGE